MGRKKSLIKIAKRASIKCPHCSNVMRFDVPVDGLLSFADCKSCKQKIATPRSKCCLVCAFSDKQCTPSNIMEARIKGLEVRGL